MSDDERRDARVAAGVPEAIAEMLLGTFRAARRGALAEVGLALEMLGRRPRTIRDVLANTLSSA